MAALKPLLRAAKYGAAYRLARLRAAYGREPETAPASVAFVVGCGRSGTTVLGKMLALHPDVTYLFEPYHLWAAADPICDALNLYGGGEGRYILRESHLNAAAAARLRRLIIGKAKPGTCLVEKTPLNVARIDYLDALVPNARYIHLVRDGYEVASSIARLASKNSYRIAGKPDMNQWWGVGDYKWRALVRDGQSAGYYPGQVTETDGLGMRRGAYEWLVSLREVDRYRSKLGRRLLEIRYPDLVSETIQVLTDVCDLLDIRPRREWLAAAARLIRHDFRESTRKPLELPLQMAEGFKRYQERFGFGAIVSKQYRR